MSEIFNKLLDVLSVISDGGPKSIVTILVICVCVVIMGSFYQIKFVIKFFEKMTEAREKVVAEKDEIIKERMEKVELMVQQYNKAQADLVDALRKIEMSLHDLTNSLTHLTQTTDRAVNTMLIKHEVDRRIND